MPTKNNSKGTPLKSVRETETAAEAEAAHLT